MGWIFFRISTPLPKLIQKLWPVVMQFLWIPGMFCNSEIQINWQKRIHFTLNPYTYNNKLVITLQTWVYLYFRLCDISKRWILLTFSGNTATDSLFSCLSNCSVIGAFTVTLFLLYSGQSLQDLTGLFGIVGAWNAWFHCNASENLWSILFLDVLSLQWNCGTRWKLQKIIKCKLFHFCNQNDQILNCTGCW